MPIILNIETSSTNCSVSLSNNNKLIDCLEKDSPNYSHSQKLHSFISELMEKNNISFKDLNAVAVGIGPGSYTGLRIGVATAKGICHALNIPLIAIDTLTVLATQARNSHPGMDAYVSMLDARRMEVYSRTFNSDLENATEIEALIIPEIKISAASKPHIEVATNQEGANEAPNTPKARSTGRRSSRRSEGRRSCRSGAQSSRPRHRRWSRSSAWRRWRQRPSTCQAKSTTRAGA